MAGRGHKALPEGREVLGGPPEGPGQVNRPSRRVERGQNGLVGPPGGPG